MTGSRRVRVAGVAALILSCSRGAPTEPADYPTLDPGLETGVHAMELSLEDGGLIRFAISVPDAANDGEVPLVLALHYGGEVTPYYGKAYMEMLVLPAWRELGAVIVAPDCPGKGWADPASERAVLALLDHVGEKWPVDRRRVAVTGYSMGGGGVWHFLARHPERFTAAIPVAGWPSEEVGTAVPIYAIHGRRDEVVDIAPTEREIARLRAAGADARLVVVDGPTHYETAAFVEPLAAALPWLHKVWGE